MALGRLEIGGLFAPHLKPSLSPERFVAMYGCLAERLKQETQGQGQGGRDAGNTRGNVSLHVVSMLLTKVRGQIWAGVQYQS